MDHPIEKDLQEPLREPFIGIWARKSRIIELYPGGWESFAKDHAAEMVRLQHDEHLVLAGAMSPWDAEHWINFFESLGLQAMDEKEETWVDICVTEMGHPTAKCEWIVSSYDGTWLKGTRTHGKIE